PSQEGSALAPAGTAERCPLPGAGGGGDRRNRLRLLDPFRGPGERSCSPRSEPGAHGIGDRGAPGDRRGARPDRGGKLRSLRGLRKRDRPEAPEGDPLCETLSSLQENRGSSLVPSSLRT